MAHRSNPKRNNRSPRQMKIPYLGKFDLFWCNSCNIPLLSAQSCDICHHKGSRVPISPPGDVRPAFIQDYHSLQETFNRQFGPQVGDLIFDVSTPVLLNRIGGLDRTEEVIVDGNILGIFKYNIVEGQFEFHPRLAGGQYIFLAQELLGLPHEQAIWITADALPFILDGKSILVPSIESIGVNIRTDDHCLILYRNPDTIPLSTTPPLQVQEVKGESLVPNTTYLVAVGLAKMSGGEMASLLPSGKGNLCKNRAHYSSLTEAVAGKDQAHCMKSRLSLRTIPPLAKQDALGVIIDNFKTVYRGNRTVLDKKIATAEKFIQTTIERESKPIAVAYSGGKDSLGVLLLVWRVIGPNFKIFFANTGLELPEVEQNVFEIAQRLGMEDKLLIKNAHEKFWELLPSFGPPGRDYRYCCHSLKAQQITELITDLYGGEKVLSFLGQRQFESLTRSQSKMVYVNSFIPLQIAATPIKSWTALELWLFILNTELFHPVTKAPIAIPITPLYFLGHERLGCYLCPAANLSSFRLLEESHPALHSKWFSYLDAYAHDHGLPEEWVRLGLWRFKKFSPQWTNFIQEHGIKLAYSSADPSTPLTLQITKGFSPCLQSGYSVKGRYSQPIDLERVAALLPTLTPEFTLDEELNVLTIQSVYKREKYRLNLFSDGSFFLLSPSREFDYHGLLLLLSGSIFRVFYCNLCGTCASICPTGAISYLDHKIEIDTLKCVSCTKCISHCPFYQLSKKTVDSVGE